MTLAWQPQIRQDAAAHRFLIGDSEAIRAVRRLIEQVAPTAASVLVSGPSGSGKEMVARAIHAESPRADGPFVAVNCGAIPRDLLESELFGHEKGAFTGAVTQQRGRFEDAHGGTLFLDEIGDMPPEMQVKLLRVLEERMVTRVGGRTPIAVDVRIISATHRDLNVAIDEARFREDLYYRLAVFPMILPPLSAHRDDIPLLIEHFLRHFAGKRGPRFTPDGLARLIEHRWPGNVRELRNVIERAAILHAAGLIDAAGATALLGRHAALRPDEREALWTMSAVSAAPACIAPHAPREDMFEDGPVDLRALIAELEQRHIEEALRRARGVVADAARLLTLQRTTLIEKMGKYGIARLRA